MKPLFLCIMLVCFSGCSIVDSFTFHGTGYTITIDKGENGKPRVTTAIKPEPIHIHF